MTSVSSPAFTAAIRTVFESVANVNRLDQHEIEYLDALTARWTLGRNHPELISADLGASSRDLHSAARTISSALSREGLGILLADIEELCTATNAKDHSLDQLRQWWTGQFSDVRAISAAFKQDGSFKPNSVLGAVGYIFAVTARVDGSLHWSEFHAIRNGLASWDNESARIILAAINWAWGLRGPLSFDGILRRARSFSETEKQSLENSLQYLRDELDEAQRRIISDQVREIVAADGVVHPNERYILDCVNRIWSDCE